MESVCLSEIFCNPTIRVLFTLITHISAFDNVTSRLVALSTRGQTIGDASVGGRGQNAILRGHGTPRRAVALTPSRQPIKTIRTSYFY